MNKAKKGKVEVLTGSHRVGLIEETSDNIYSIKFVLLSIGYEVASFSFKEAYLESLVEFDPDLLVVDMMIPDGGAYAVIRSLKGGNLDKVPILAVTADAMDGTDEDVYGAGAQDTLAKPYSVEALQSKLRALLE